jgi:hypothetical protein
MVGSVRENQMAEVIEAILNRFGMLLRFVAPGFVGLLALPVLLPSRFPFGMEFYGKPATTMLL